MSADRSKVTELAMTPLEMMKARGASKKEIDLYIKRRDAMMFGRKKK